MAKTATTMLNNRTQARALFAHDLIDPLSLVVLNLTIIQEALAGPRELPAHEREALARIAGRTLEAARCVVDASKVLRALDG